MRKNRSWLQFLLTLLVIMSFSAQTLMPLPAVAQSDSKKMFEQNEKLLDELTHKDNSTLNEKTKNAGHLTDRFKDLDKQTEFMPPENSAPIYANLLLGAVTAKILADEDFCRLYKKLRGPGGKFDKSNSSDSVNVTFAALDDKALVTCKEKKPPACPKGLKTINDCIKEGASVDLIGDGVSTTHCTVQLANPKSGATTTAQIQTVCISKHTQRPPQPSDESKKNAPRYTLGGAAPKELVNIVKAARKLSNEGKFDSVPLPEERKAGTIMQLGIWRHLGGTNPKDKDAVTRDSLTSDLLSRAHIAPKSLSPEQKKQLTNRVDDIIAAVDLTEKTAQTINDDDGKKPQESLDPQSTKKPDEPDCPGKPDEVQRTAQQQRNSSNCANQPTGSSPQPSAPPPPPLSQAKVCIPEFTVFESQNKDCQDMMTVSECLIDCPNPDGGATPAGSGNPGGLKNPPQDEPIADRECHYVGFKTFPKLEYDESTDDRSDKEKKERSDQISAEKRRLGEMGKGFFDEDEALQTRDKAGDSDMYIFFVCPDAAGNLVKAFKLTPDEAKNFEFSEDPKVDAKRKTNREKIRDKYRHMPDQKL